MVEEVVECVLGVCYSVEDLGVDIVCDFEVVCCDLDFIMNFIDCGVIDLLLLWVFLLSSVK